MCHSKIMCHLESHPYPYSFRRRRGHRSWRARPHQLSRRRASPPSGAPSPLTGGGKQGGWQGGYHRLRSACGVRAGHCMPHAAPAVLGTGVRGGGGEGVATAFGATVAGVRRCRRPGRHARDFDAALCVERLLVAQRLVGAPVLAVPVVVRGREIATCSQSAPARLVRAVRLGGG